MDDMFRVGVITSTHGIRGEVKVFPTTDDPARFKKLKTVFLDTGHEMLTLTVAQVRFFKNQVIVKFKEYDNINDIEKYKGHDLYVSRDQAVRRAANEYYIADLLDLQVLLEDGSIYGVLKDVMQTGANDVYIIERSNGREILVPAIKDCICKVDLDERQMVIHLLPGLDEE